MHDDHEKRINRLEHTLFGSDESPHTGLVSRFMMTESIALDLKSYAVKIVALLVIGILTAVLNLIISSRPIHAGSATQSTSVITSDAARAAGSASRKEWFTVQEVADREKLDEHTITNYIARGQIQPPPVKAGKAYQIANDYRIIPNDTEPSRTLANNPPMP